MENNLNDENSPDAMIKETYAVEAETSKAHNKEVESRNISYENIPFSTYLIKGLTPEEYSNIENYLNKKGVNISDEMTFRGDMAMNRFKHKPGEYIHFMSLDRDLEGKTDELLSKLSQNYDNLQYRKLPGNESLGKRAVDYTSKRGYSSK
ncbi:MAG: hypothetical protein ACQEP1_02875 [Nanobdellota archaeon]